jgi:hypothetical protein
VNNNHGYWFCQASPASQQTTAKTRTESRITMSQKELVIYALLVEMFKMLNITPEVAVPIMQTLIDDVKSHSQYRPSVAGFTSKTIN